MSQTILIGMFLILLWRLWSYLTRDDHMGGMPTAPSPWWDILKSEKDRERRHVALATLAKKYGPIVKIPGFFGKPTVMVSSYENIYEVLVKQGKEFGGRLVAFHQQRAGKNTGIIFRQTPDKKWKNLRKVAQLHMRAFGDGMSELQSVIAMFGQSMVSEFNSHTGKPFDPLDTITLSAIRTIGQVMLGQGMKPDDAIVNLIHIFDKTARSRFTQTVSHLLLEAFPWLRYFGNTHWNIIQKEIAYSKQIWQMVIDKSLADPSSKNIYSSFKPHITSSTENKDEIENTDAEVASLNLIIAEVTTTSSTFYAALNILSHNKQIQDKMYEETQNKIENDEQINFDNRSLLPYLHATLLELLRYTSIVPLALDHKACTSAMLDGYVIPEGTGIATNLWGLHYDPDFWEDPESCRPECFLDEANEVVPADHPSRKHLLAFGAGTRVCVGETLAVARLFLWLSMIVKNFEILPVPGNNV